MTDHQGRMCPNTRGTKTLAISGSVALVDWCALHEWPSGALQRPEFASLGELGSDCLMTPSARVWRHTLLYFFPFYPSPFFHVDWFIWCLLHKQQLPLSIPPVCASVSPHTSTCLLWAGGDGPADTRGFTGAGLVVWGRTVEM